MNGFFQFELHYEMYFDRSIFETPLFFRFALLFTESKEAVEACIRQRTGPSPDQYAR